MELDNVRKELNNYDNMIKNMITLRMSLIPIVADIKTKNNLPLFQGKREEEIYNNIEKFAVKNGVDNQLIKNIYKLIIKNALDIEERFSNEKNSLEIDDVKFKNIENEFQKLDDIIQNQIPEIISNIQKECNNQKLNLNKISTLYYNNKINKGEN